VDLVSLRKNHRGKELVMIEDYKTAGRRPNIGELLLAVQFTVYTFATLQPEFWFGHPGTDFKALPNAAWYWELLKDAPRRALWIQLMNHCEEIDAGERDDDDFQRVYRMCCEIERAIEHNVYVPMIGKHCTICDYANGPCPVKIPSRAEWESLDRIEADENAWL
jgi:hypothetical protein